MSEALGFGISKGIALFWVSGSDFGVFAEK